MQTAFKQTSHSELRRFSCALTFLRAGITVSTKTFPFIDPKWPADYTMGWLGEEEKREKQNRESGASTTSLLLMMTMSGDLSENIGGLTYWRLLPSRNDPSLACWPDFVGNCGRPWHNPRMKCLVSFRGGLQLSRQDECLLGTTTPANLSKSFDLLWREFRPLWHSSTDMWPLSSSSSNAQEEIISPWISGVVRRWTPWRTPNPAFQETRSLFFLN